MPRIMLGVVTIGFTNVAVEDPERSARDVASTSRPFVTEANTGLGEVGLNPGGWHQSSLNCC